MPDIAISHDLSAIFSLPRILGTIHELPYFYSSLDYDISCY
ncbi:hypothetical protein TUMEXPCC7403_16765 [Tumidithrix helvetica PCC 7403]